MLQPIHSNPFQPKTVWEGFFLPTETNAFTRLPSISANLNDLQVVKSENGVAKLWAVGDGGAILHSPDGGRCWEAQGPWAPEGATAVCGPHNLWHQMSLFPSAKAAEKAIPQKKTPDSQPVSINF